MIQLASVSPGDGYTIHVTTVDGRTAQIDLTDTVTRLKIMRPIREDRVLFESVRLDEESDGHAIKWTDDIDMCTCGWERHFGP
jgi:hypothetical protein